MDPDREDRDHGAPSDDAPPAAPSKASSDERPPLGETAEQPAVEESAHLTGGPSDQPAQTETGPVPPAPSDPDRVGPASTNILPPVDGPSSPPRWSARAPVRARDVVEDEHVGWDVPPRGVLVPILVTVLILLLVALLGLGTWLIFAARPSGPTPANTPTVQNATPPATSTGPTSSRPPTPVPLPDLRGQDYETAAAILTQRGFVPVRVDEVDSEVPKGKVKGTDPPAGTPVLPGVGARINVIVSLGPPVTPTAPPSETASPEHS